MNNEIHFGRAFCLWLLFCSPVIYAGCNGPRLDVPAPGTYSPLVAVSLGVAASETNPAPSPTPNPTPGKCENCNGTGKLGDGTVSVPCPVCGGDGRTDQHETNIVPAAPVSDPVPVVDEPADPKQHPRYDKSRGVVLPEGFEKTEYEFREAEPHPNQTRQRRGWRLLPRNRQGASYMPAESSESNESSGASAASC